MGIKYRSTYTGGLLYKSFGRNPTAGKGANIWSNPVEMRVDKPRCLLVGRESGAEIDIHRNFAITSGASIFFSACTICAK